MRLALSLLCAAALSAAPGDILAVRVVGSTTTVTDATSACNSGSACDGWVLEVDVDALAVGGSYNLGIGTRNNTTNATAYCDVTGEGYTAGAVLTTTTRRMYATKALRKVYNAAYTAPYPADEIFAEGRLTLRLALSDFVYSGETLSCAIGAGLYTQGGTPTAAYSGAATNASTLTHDQSRVLGNWSWPAWTRINASLAGDGTNNADGSVTVRAVAYHRAAKDGKPVAAVVFTLSDGTTTRTTTATAMTSDASFGDAVRVVEYVGTFTAAQIQAFPNGTAATLNFAAYPWVGGSAGVLDTATSGNTQPTPLISPRTLLIDHAGTYGTSAAVVNSDPMIGNDTTCVAVAESAFNANSPPDPCLTINGAAVKIRARNNSSHARGDAAGVIYLAAGNHAWTGASVSITGTANTWTVIRPLPGVARADVVINSLSGNGHLGTGTKIKLQNVTLNISSAPATVFANSTQYLWIDQCDLTSNATSATIVAPSFFVTRSIVRNCRTCLQNFSTAFAVLVRGNTVMPDYAQSASMWTILGNSITGNSGGNTTFTFFSSPSTTPATWWPIVAYNRLTRSAVTGSSPIQHAQTTGTPPVGSGAAIVQNVFEWVSSFSRALVAIANDSSTVTPVRNIMLWHNTLVGQRTNRAYNDEGSTLRLRNLWSEIGNLYDSAALKADTFNHPSSGRNAARVGNWSVLYGVGNFGNMDVEAGTPSNPVGLEGTWQPEFPGLLSDWIPTVASSNEQSSTQPPANSAGMRPVNYQQFVAHRAWNGITPGAGEGDYQLLSGSPAISLIPAGRAVLPVDIEGYPRRNDGVGAAGAYEIRTLARPRTRVVQ